MPASICDPVSSALRLSLNADESHSSSLLDNRLLSSAKGVLLSKIDFEESGDYQSNVLDGLKSKYVVIRPKKPAIETKILKKDGNVNSSLTDNKNGENGLPNAKRTLFPLGNIQLGWGARAWSVGAGMQNVGNTCYLNSTLQALFHVPALANWLMSEGPHADKCRQAEGCVICGMRATLLATQKSGGSPIKPWQVYSKLRLICRHLTPGRQEDAHEFLRYLVEAMEKGYLSRFPNMDKLDQHSKETTPLNQILGGYLRSTVRCLACHHLSTTHQPFQDLLLDIRKHTTLDEALDSFFSRERLEDLGYKCEACNKKVSATKQFFVERAPMVLCVALKRFSLAGGKLSKHIQFRKRITLGKYMFHKQNQNQLSYRLVGMVTHLGPSQNCGHYTAIGQAPNGNFYQFDDSCVRPLPLSAVLATNAYIMFFEKENSTPEETAVSSTAASSSSGTIYGPQLPDSILNREKSPLKLTYFKNDCRKPISFNFESNTTETKPKIDAKPPIILNSTLSKANESNGSNSEPWVVKQNGEIEKVNKTTNGADRTVYKFGEDGTLAKNNIITKGSKLVIHSECKSMPRIESDVKLTNGNQKLPEQSDISKLVKSPLEKLEEQMSKSDSSFECSKVQRNGVYSSKLVPYDSESESGDERGEKSRLGVRVGGETGCAGAGVWTVSREDSRPLLSPSLNGVVNNKVKEKDEIPRLSEENGKSPNTSTSTMSPASDHSDKGLDGPKLPASFATAPPLQNGTKPANLLGRHDTLHTMQHMSHRGYGAPVNSWTGTQSNMGRQVFEERRVERKRAAEGQDEMDAGRAKRNKFNNYKHFNNTCHNSYNPFQEKQNKQHWGGNFKFHGDRRPPHHFHNKHYNKYKRFNRYGNGHHYPRHH